MNILEYLDNVGKRKADSERPGEGPRLTISFIVLALFAYALAHNPSEQLLIGALISMASTAIGYWLGSSKGSSDKDMQIEAVRKSAEGE